MLLSLIGTAQAWDAQVLDINGNSLASNPSDISLGQTLNLSLEQTGINANVVSVNYTISVTPNDGKFTAALLRDTAAVTAPSDTDLDLFTVTLTNDPTAVGTMYTVYVDVLGYDVNGVQITGAQSAGKFDATGSHSFNAIPEFPTIALPVAAILGLAFFFQRRKEE
ncbi:PEF-CTERM sorting domain-containing protein [Methanolobus sp. ZRKC3]|uniref:PEF-CTERM sorting domain-containing protein n=1 Tax=Methanolobus sp. ZRKC3 TaxID=3125786 RepID=UPI003254078C